MPRSLRRCWRASARAEVLVIGMLAAGFAGSGLVARPVVTSPNSETPATQARVTANAPLQSHADAVRRERWLEAAYDTAQEEKLQQAVDQQRAEHAA
ncbi:MAG TPA: hypothetical protein VFX21_05880, partial [Acidimicrobiia bacterium]|nr:hypothetical protein [Acidimicrobiia bacterium]